MPKKNPQSLINLEPLRPYFARICIVFFVIWLAVALFYRVEHSNERQQAAALDRDELNYQTTELCRDLDNIAATSCFIDQFFAEKEDVYAASDLKAQQDMAELALAMLFATVLGVVLLAATLYESNQTMLAVQRDFDANHPAKLLIKEPTVVMKAGSKLVGSVFLINAGSTPARLQPDRNKPEEVPVIRANIVFFLTPENRLPMSSIFNELEPIEKNRLDNDAEFIRPGWAQQWEFTGRIVTQVDIDRIESGELKLYLWGLIRYADKLDTHRRTMFCRRYDPKAGCFVSVDNENFEYST